MRRFLVPVLAALGLAVSTIVVTAAPASALYTTSISAVDASQPGHITGTVTTTAPYVRIDLLNDWDGEVVLGQPQAVTGPVPFDLATWGLWYAKVRAVPCAAPDSCESTGVQTDPMLAATINPTVTWPEDTTIGKDQEYVVQVSDPSGGGLLDAVGGYENWHQSLNRNGATSLQLTDGRYFIEVIRCHPDNPVFCRDTQIMQIVDVQRHFEPHVKEMTPLNVSPALGTQPTLTFYSTKPDMTVDWHLVTEPGHVAVPGFGGSTPTTGPQEAQQFSIDLTGLGNGMYSVVGTATVNDPDFGPLDGQFSGPTFWVDSDAPALESIATSGTTVYPVADDYLDWIKIDLHGLPGTSQDQMKVEILDAGGTVVRTITASHDLDSNSERFQFNGRSKGGALLPEGDYTVRGVIFDAAGNSNEMLGAVVSVSHLKLVKKIFSKTVTPAASFEQQYVGACSQVARPSARGWAGSFGLYSNTRCTRGDEASFVETHHTIRVPAAVKYGDARISLYGGAARSKPNSAAVIVYYKADEDWGHAKRASSTLGTHHGSSEKASELLHDERWLYWAAFTGFGMRYDVKSFTAKVEYYVLVAL